MEKQYRCLHPLLQNKTKRRKGRTLRNRASHTHMAVFGAYVFRFPRWLLFSAENAGPLWRCVLLGRIVAKSEYLALDWGRETSLKNHLKSLKESPTNDEKRKKESGGQGGCVCV